MNMPQFDITGQKVLAVGAGRGIGKGIALAFAEAGADVAVTGLTDVGASRVAGEIRALGRSAISLSGDATLAADMERIAQQVLAEFGRVDTLINCVGVRHSQTGSEASRYFDRRDDRGGVASSGGH